MAELVLGPIGFGTGWRRVRAGMNVASSFSHREGRLNPRLSYLECAPVWQVSASCYHEEVGFRVVIEKVLDAWALELNVGLTRAESAGVFMSGDSLLQWPAGGLRSMGNLPIERTSMFISEASARPEGLRLEYAEHEQVAIAATVLRTQLLEAGIHEESGLTSDGPAGHGDPLKDALVDYLTIPGMLAAILVSDQGFMISGASAGSVDTASIAALVADTLSSAQRLGTQASGGPLGTMTAEYEHLTLLVAPFSGDVMLVIVAEPGSIAASSPKPGSSRAAETKEDVTERTPQLD